MKNKNRLTIWILILILTFFALYHTKAQRGSPEAKEAATEEILEELGLDELTDGYCTLLDDDGNRLMRTARVIYVGNQYLTHDNKLYEVYSVVGRTAYARYIKDVDISARLASGLISPAVAGMQPIQQQDNKVIGIYHTHGDESYVPTDGTASKKEGGGILRVGEVFARALEEKRVGVLHSKETHLPHDAGAYLRSRRTAEELLQENPDALFDIHRDAVPAEEYSTTINGQQVTKIQLVVGQENQNHATIREFAEGLKAVTDQKYPGLVKGIFFGKGNYNQDLSPRSILLEVGTHKNPREHAEAAVQLFSDATNTYLYGEGTTARSWRTRSASTASRTIVWVLLLTVLAGGGYLYLTTGSWEKAVQKVRQFTRTELLNFLGRRPKPPRKDDSPPDGS